MILMQIKYYASGYGRYYYPYFEVVLWREGERLGVISSTQIKGNKFLLFMDILKRHNWNLSEPFAFEALTDQTTADILLTLKGLRGRFPEKYLKIKDRQKLLEALQAMKIAQELKQQ